MPLGDQLACFAIATPGVESLLASELDALGIAVGESEPGGVEFQATRRQLADALLWSRTANRITVRLAVFHARTFAELERAAAKVPWADVIALGDSVHFRVTSKKSKLYHDGGIAERLEKVAAASIERIDVVRAAGVAGEMDEEDITIGRIGRIRRIVVRVMRDEVTLSADAAGPLMYLRGYRQAVAKAPLRETLGAALLLASGWDPALPLLDPMCGSGTIAIEAALIARRMAPGRARKFSAEAWPGFGEAFASARGDAASRELATAPSAITGHDRDVGAIAASQANAERAGVGADVKFAQGAISTTVSDDGRGWIVTNPPYGARIGEKTALRDLYAVLGRVMRERRPGWRFVMLSADRMLEGQMGMKLEEVLRTTNGGLPVRGVRDERRETRDERGKR